MSIHRRWNSDKESHWFSDRDQNTRIRLHTHVILLESWLFTTLYKIWSRPRSPIYLSTWEHVNSKWGTENIQLYAQTNILNADIVGVLLLTARKAASRHCGPCTDIRLFGRHQERLRNRAKFESIQPARNRKVLSEVLGARWLGIQQVCWLHGCICLLQEKVDHVTVESKRCPVLDCLQ